MEVPNRFPASVRPTSLLLPRFILTEPAFSPLIGLVIATFYMPESPRWLAKNGKKEEALQVLGRLRAEDGIVNEESQAEFNDIENALKLEAANSFSYAKMFFTSCGKLHMSRRVSDLLGLVEDVLLIMDLFIGSTCDLDPDLARMDGYCGYVYTLPTITQTAAQ